MSYNKSLYTFTYTCKPLQYYCLENSMDRRAWQTIVQGFADLDMTQRIARIHTHTHIYICIIYMRYIYITIYIYIPISYCFCFSGKPWLIQSFLNQKRTISLKKLYILLNENIISDSLPGHLHHIFSVRCKKYNNSNNYHLSSTFVHHIWR